MPKTVGRITSRIALLLVLSFVGLVGAIGDQATAQADDEAAVREALVKSALSFE
jgi:hypothetical protein